MNRRPPILVLDGEQRAALAVTRSLGRQGYPVHVGSSLPRPMAGGSRYCTSETLLPDPATETAAFASAVIRSAEGTRAEVLLPLTDASVLSVLEHAERFGTARIPMSDLAGFRRASDKQAVLSLARAIGIEAPLQWVVPEHGAAAPAIPSDRFPVVLKPARSVAGAPGERIKVPVSYARSRAELARSLQSIPKAVFPVLVQAQITGPGIGVFLLRWEGVTRASFVHRRIREFPPSGGVSVTCESIPAPGGVVEQAEALLTALDWSGVAMVEFKQDAGSGRHYLMEVNPRFWGSLQLAIDAGVDFPWYLVRLALGEEVEPVRQWRTGLRSRWEWGEVDYLIARLRRSRTELHLPGDAPGKLGALWGALQVWRPRQRGAVFRFGDPAPFVRESVAWFQALMG
ncbi:MAG: carboxylate--amine ligase [Gemmatimonadales bacterium]